MPESSNDLLRTLSEAIAVSGGESEVRKLIRARLDGVVDDIQTDVMGNLTAIRKGTGASGLRVLVTAHMDEPGFMVASIGDNGLISVVEIGDHDLRYIPTQRVVVGRDKQPGVFLWVPIHKSRNQALQHIDSMHIDVGAAGKGAVRAKPGDRIGYLSAFRQIDATVVRGKAFDRSAACCALLALLDGEPFPFDLAIAFTTQAHIRGRGARVAARRFDPQIVISLSGVTATDTYRDPTEPDRMSVIALGSGPVLVVNDHQYAPSRPLIEHIKQSAAHAGIPIQIAAHGKASTDAAAIAATSLAGALTLAVPVRYLGTPHALMNTADLDNLTALTRAALGSIQPAVLESHA